ncbi:sugar isomerase [Echinicola strongylocentroti]|uniref:Sugar isomerase n=1 Tax=Echinicola strongylocentroti TaxID=1795355 RepID=A0A2Z4IGV9_9BACT|nr:SIS domain-containing protein [Echinicola strongylocentroti]AWW29947.1 sugar isomerase [Echinicola strongylocentroti]
MIQTTYLTLDGDKAEEVGAFHTAKEIAGQPELWRQVFAQIESEKTDIQTFLAPILAKKNARLILTGAGSSAFIGESAQGVVQQFTGVHTQAIATTDLVTHPALFFLEDAPTVLVSFARSGNSPESVETVKLADEYCGEIYHLIITCNPDGQLAAYANDCEGNCYALVLPESANDNSLAMTGSFTSMLLAVLLVAGIDQLEELKADFDDAVQTATNILTSKLEEFEELAKLDFERVIFLGSGPMLGIARECHLKLQELTDGQVVCKHDSFLGFRHGPRAVANEDAIVVYLFSKDPHVVRYETDLATSIGQDKRGIKTISFAAEQTEGYHSVMDVPAVGKGEVAVFNVLPATMMGQLLGFYKCLQLGLKPDNPSVSGAISRVVQGVVIYNKEK